MGPSTCQLVREHGIRGQSFEGLVRRIGVTPPPPSAHADSHERPRLRHVGLDTQHYNHPVAHKLTGAISGTAGHSDIDQARQLRENQGTGG